METFYYEVVSIDGDYANLKRTDIESEDLKLVARALLPAEICEGSRLKYEWMQYEMIWYIDLEKCFILIYLGRKE